MGGAPSSIGPIPWDRRQLIDELARFAALYDERPIDDNSGGMRAPHLFAIWNILRASRPAAIVESGVWLGQGTWLFERTCPDAALYCIDPELDRIRYRSARAQYFDRDFGTLDWSHLPAERTLLFFDDHQNAFERVKQARRLGLTRMVFEDNYPAGVGDCYSLKKAFAHAGFEPEATSLKGKLTRALNLSSGSGGRVAPNSDDAATLRAELAVYHEFPPVLKPSHTRWGDRWDERYPTPEPLLTSASEPHHALFEREAKDYTWLCYAELAPSP